MRESVELEPLGIQTEGDMYADILRLLSDGCLPEAGMKLSTSCLINIP